MSLTAIFNQSHSCTNQELFQKHLCNQSSHCKNMNSALHPVNGAAPINCRLKYEVSIMLHCQRDSTHYTAMQIKNFLKSTSVLKVATMKSTKKISRIQRKLSRVPPNQYISLLTKMNGTQRSTSYPEYIDRKEKRIFTYSCFL